LSSHQCPRGDGRGGRAHHFPEHAHGAKGTGRMAILLNDWLKL
jgi:hypothetical protein